MPDICAQQAPARWTLPHIRQPSLSLFALLLILPATEPSTVTRRRSARQTSPSSIFVLKKPPNPATVALL